MLITDLRGIKFDFDHFCMTGLMTANLFVGRIFGCAAGVAARGRSHTFGIPKQFFDTPKTSRAERRFFDTHATTIKREKPPCNRGQLEGRALSRPSFYISDQLCVAVTGEWGFPFTYHQSRFTPSRNEKLGRHGGRPSSANRQRTMR